MMTKRIPKETFKRNPLQTLSGTKTGHGPPRIFFPGSCLVVHTTWSVKESEKEKTTIKVNWGEARFAGETVRHKLPCLKKDHYQANTPTTQGQGPPRNPGSPRQEPRARPTTKAAPSSQVPGNTDQDGTTKTVITLMLDARHNAHTGHPPSVDCLSSAKWQPTEHHS